ncbi:hypothetical protein D0862_01084 [Hortaea werneckii]|uniref:Uncharacterized protein n=1 Tax=Hortaea werneckii TaxID=91943 RepID=A0A3M7HUN7_HORWE|nr:hypothetical protein D0862_01084 [Hortaea werneckii]
MSTTSFTTKQLHWTQRIALIRHNLHAASRSGEFVFFKTLQAGDFIEGTNHVATLTAAIGDDADTVLAAMDNLNAGLAYVHEDAFKAVYDNLKEKMRDEDSKGNKSKLHVDIAMQKNKADMAIDKMAGSAIGLIQMQPEHVHDTAASVWITGVSIVADAIEIALREMDSLEYKLDDFIRMEESWNTVKASVVGSITGLKGVFSLMDPGSPQGERPSPRSASIASAGSAVFRRLSNAFTYTNTPSQPSSRQASIASTSSLPSANMNANFANFARNNSISSQNGPVYRTPNYVRNSVSNGCPTSMPANNSNWGFHKLPMVPPTPAYDEQADPFDTSVAPSVPEMPAVPEIAATASPAPHERRMSMMVN